MQKESDIIVIQNRFTIGSFCFVRYPVIFLTLLAPLFVVGCNPFAPTLDDDLSPASTLLGDQRTIPGVFRNLEYAYTYRDTLIYGELLDPDFEFRYFNPDRATDVAFNRDEEMRITANLFRGADQIELQWNQIQTQNGDSILATITRAYDLRITLQANESFIIEGLATIRLIRNSAEEPWRIRLWRDDSDG